MKQSSRLLFVALAIAAVLSVAPTGNADGYCPYYCVEGYDTATCYSAIGDLAQCTALCDCMGWSCQCWCRTQWCYWT